MILPLFSTACGNNDGIKAGAEQKRRRIIFLDAYQHLVRSSLPRILMTAMIQSDYYCKMEHGG